MRRPATERQIKFLADLGFSSQTALSIDEASAAIDALTSGKGNAAATKAVHRVRKQRLSELKKEARKDIRECAAENREFTDESHPEGIYAGFLFLRAEELEPGQMLELSEKSRKLIGAFLPIQVAVRNPEILAESGIEYEIVDVDDILPIGTPMIVSADKIARVSNEPYLSRGGSKIGLIRSCLIAFCVIALLGCAGIAAVAIGLH